MRLIRANQLAFAYAVIASLAAIVNGLTEVVTEVLLDGPHVCKRAEE